MNKYATAALANSIKNLYSNIAAKSPSAVEAARIAANDAKLISEWERRAHRGSILGTLGGVGVAGALAHKASNSPAFDAFISTYGMPGVALAGLGGASLGVAGTLAGGLGLGVAEASRYMKNIKKLDPAAYSRLKAQGY